MWPLQSLSWTGVWQFLFGTNCFLHWPRLFLHWLCWHHGTPSIESLIAIHAGFGTQLNNRLNNWRRFYWKVNCVATCNSFVVKSGIEYQTLCCGKYWKADDQVNGMIWKRSDDISFGRTHWSSLGTWWRQQGQKHGGVDTVYQFQNFNTSI